MKSSDQQLLWTLRTAAFNNAAAAELLRRVSGYLLNAKLVGEMQRIAAQLDKDADSLEVFVPEIREGRLRRSVCSVDETPGS